MDTDTLVESRVADGRKLIGLLELKGIDLAAAAWVSTGESGRWSLYLATGDVDTKGLESAYREVNAVLRSMRGIGIATDEVKLVGRSNAIARDLLAIRGDSTSGVPVRYRGSLPSGIGVEEVYIYPPHAPLRLPFTVSYTRRAGTNRWQPQIEQGDVLTGVSASGAMSYATVRWEGEAAGTEMFARVLVLVEIGPQFEEADAWDHPAVRRTLKRQAETIANEMFQSHHPDAVIEPIDDQEPRAGGVGARGTR